MENTMRSVALPQCSMWEKLRNTVTFLANPDDHAVVMDRERDWTYFDLNRIHLLCDNSLKTCAMHFIVNPWDQDYDKVYSIVGEEMRVRGMDYRKFRRHLFAAYMKYSKARFSEFSERWPD